MNWTGGNLQRHSQGATTGLVRRQKSHFAKIRASKNALGSEHGNSIIASDHLNRIEPPAKDSFTEPHKQRQTSAESFQNNALELSPPSDGRVTTSFEHQRRALLAKSDWVGLETRRRCMPVRSSETQIDMERPFQLPTRREAMQQDTADLGCGPDIDPMAEQIIVKIGQDTMVHGGPSASPWPVAPTTNLFEALTEQDQAQRRTVFRTIPIGDVKVFMDEYGSEQDELYAPPTPQVVHDDDKSRTLAARQVTEELVQHSIDLAHQGHNHATFAKNDDDLAWKTFVFGSAYCHEVQVGQDSACSSAFTATYGGEHDASSMIAGMGSSSS